MLPPIIKHIKLLFSTSRLIVTSYTLRYNTLLTTPKNLHNTWSHLMMFVPSIYIFSYSNSNFLHLYLTSPPKMVFFTTSFFKIPFSITNLYACLLIFYFLGQCQKYNFYLPLTITFDYTSKPRHAHMPPQSMPPPLNSFPPSPFSPQLFEVVSFMCLVFFKSFMVFFSF